VVHLAHPFDRKLSKASSVSLDRLLCFLLPIDGVSVGDLPSIMVFCGGPRSGTIHFRLEFGFIRFSPFRLFFRVHSGPVCPFSFRPWKVGLSFCPVETVRLIPQGRRRLRLMQNAIFFSSMRFCVFWTLRPSFAAFLRCLFEAGIQATSGSTGLVAASAVLVRDAPFLVLFHVSAPRAPPRLFSFSDMPYAVWLGVMSFPRFGLLTLHYLTRAGSRQIGSAGTPAGEIR
jgi:hypothetical protein